MKPPLDKRKAIVNLAFVFRLVRKMQSGINGEVDTILAIMELGFGRNKANSMNYYNTCGED